MKTLVLSWALLSSWCHGAAVTTEPGSAAAKSDGAEQEEDDGTEFLADQDDSPGGPRPALKTFMAPYDEKLASITHEDGTEFLADQDDSLAGPLPALKTFMAPYDEKLASVTDEADALKGKLTAFRDSSMARLARKRKDYNQRIFQAKQENRKLSDSNEELDKEVIRLQRRVAKKAAHLQKLQDANRKSRTDMQQLAEELEVVDKMFDKSNEAKAEEEVDKVGSTAVQPMSATLEHEEESESVPDPEEIKFIDSASRDRYEVTQTFRAENDQAESGEEEGPSGMAGEQKVPAEELSMLSKSVLVKAPQAQADLADMEPASLVELLNRNLASFQKNEESSETALWEVFKKQVKRTFHQRRQLRKREGSLQAMKNKMTKYEEQLNVSIKKAEHLQQFLDEEINKQSNYLRKVKRRMH